MLDKIKNMKIPIAVKLVTITSLLMLAATIPIALRSTFLFKDVSTARENDVNGSQAKIIAEEIQDNFQDIINKEKVVGGILYRNFPSEENREAALDLAFRGDHDLVAVEVITRVDNKDVLVKRVINEEYLKQYKVDSEYISSLRANKPFSTRLSFEIGEVEVRNSTLEGGAPLLSISLPLVKDDETGRITHVVLADIRLSRFQAIFDTLAERMSERTIFLVDKFGRTLAHSNQEFAIHGQNLSADPMVVKALSQKVNQFQSRFENEDKETIVGAYAKTLYGPIVISEIPGSIFLEPSLNVRRNAFLITGIVLFGALFFIILFSTTLTRPLEVLLRATEEVAKGNFEANASIKTKDEVGQLAQAFDKMVVGLKERDKVKTLFNKFHGTGIANKLITGEMKLGGDFREATVFFSDIRGFTATSEKATPQEVVDMLNEYFKVMVAIITKNKGVVDKFIGDAIMAVWGAPESFGNDAANALKACLEMRQALAELNATRIERKQSPIKIGMGVHSGDLIAGTIGSDDRMEYTVIGDTVNMASRIEAATKAYGTDFLVSEVTYEKVKEFFTFVQAGTATVKGKSEPLKLFKVTGYIDETGRAIEISTPYSAYEAEHADKIKAA